MSSRFIHTVACIRSFFLFRLCNIHWTCIICLVHPIHPLMVTGLLISCLLWIMLLWTWLCRYFFEALLPAFWYKPRSEVLSHMVILILSTILYRSSKSGYPYFVLVLRVKLWFFTVECNVLTVSLSNFFILEFCFFK